MHYGNRWDFSSFWIYWSICLDEALLEMLGKISVSEKKYVEFTWHWIVSLQTAMFCKYYDKWQVLLSLWYYLILRNHHSCFWICNILPHFHCLQWGVTIFKYLHICLDVLIQHKIAALIVVCKTPFSMDDIENPLIAIN